MTPAQFRVLTILLVALGIEALFSPTFTGVVSQFKKGNVTGAIGSVRTGGIWAAGGAYALAMLALIAFAAPAPDAATWIAVLILVYALLSHGDQLVPALGNLRSTLSSIGSNAKQGK